MNPEMLKQMKKMQKELEEKSALFLDKEFSLTKHGVTVLAKGSKKIISIIIGDEDLLDPEDPEILQDVLQLTINELFDMIDEEQSELMPSMPGGFGF